MPKLKRPTLTNSAETANAAARPPAALRRHNSFILFLCLVIITILSTAVTGSDLSDPALQALWFHSFTLLTLPLYTYLLLRHPGARPDLTNPLTVAVLAFLFITLLATLVGVNPIRSFWGSYERQTGAYHLLHLTLLYFYVILLAQVAPRFLTVVLKLLAWIGALASVYTLIVALGMRPLITDWWWQRLHRSSSIYGNPIYFAGFLVLPLALTAYFCCRASRNAARALYAILFALQLAGIYLSGTRAVAAALAISVLLAGVLFALHGKVRAYRHAALGLLATAALAVVLVVIGGTRFSESSVIYRLAHLSDSSSEVRQMFWRVGLAGFRDRPILGVGPESYSVIFHKHYDIRLRKSGDRFNPASSMVLWDKPHNSALEILLTTGLGGALAYLAIFVLTLRAFVRARQNKLVSWGEMVVLVCGSVAYQIQGLFGFDSPAATVTLSVYTGFAAGLWIQPRRNLGGHAVIGRSLGLPSRAAVVTLMLLSCWGIYITDVVTASTILNIQDGAAMTGINDRIAKDCLDKADESLFVYDRNALSRQYTVLAVRVAARRQSVPQFVHSVFDAATSATHRAIDRAANEEELWLELIHLCFLRAKYDQVPVGTSIEQAIRKAIELAPDRIEPWEYLARYNLDKDVADAERIVDHILKSDPRSAQSFWIRALAYRHDGRQELAAESAMEAINLGYNPELFGDLAWLIDYYAKRHMYSDVIGLYNMWIGIDPDDSQSYEGLARTFAEEGDSVKAKAAWNQWKVCDLVEKHAYRQLARFYERVLPSNATDPGLYVSLARVYLELGEKEKAKLAAKRAAELNSDLGFRMRLFVSVLQ